MQFPDICATEEHISIVKSYLDTILRQHVGDRQFTLQISAAAIGDLHQDNLQEVRNYGIEPVDDIATKSSQDQECSNFGFQSQDLDILIPDHSSLTVSDDSKKLKLEPEHSISTECQYKTLESRDCGDAVSTTSMAEGGEAQGMEVTHFGEDAQAALPRATSGKPRLQSAKLPKKRTKNSYKDTDNPRSRAGYK